MRKSDKKLDTQIRNSLKQLCETRLESIDGFSWVTHVANYSNFPKSFKVICVFVDNNSLKAAEGQGHTQQILQSLKTVFKQLNLGLAKPEQYIVFDTEENCEVQHSGNWARRLQALY